MAAVAHRASLEEAGPRAESERRLIRRWLLAHDLVPELAPIEAQVLRKPLGRLASYERSEARWYIEAVSVLCWALGRSRLLPIDQLAVPLQVMENIGFLADQLEDLQPAGSQLADVRGEEELTRRAQRATVVHCRLQRQALTPGRVSLRETLQEVGLGRLSTSGLALIEGDLAVGGRPLGELPNERFHELFNAARLRHQAFNWLLGAHQDFTRVPTLRTR